MSKRLTKYPFFNDQNHFQLTYNIDKERIVFIELAGSMPTLNKTYSQHWSERHKLKNHLLNEMAKAKIMSDVRSFTPMEKASLSFDIYKARLFDYDNLVASMKPIIDVLKGWIIKDDNYKRLGSWLVKQHKVESYDDEKIQILITENLFD